MLERPYPHIPLYKRKLIQAHLITVDPCLLSIIRTNPHLLSLNKADTPYMSLKEIFVYDAPRGGCSFSIIIEKTLYLLWSSRQVIIMFRETDGNSPCSTRQMRVPCVPKADVYLSSFKENLCLLHNTRQMLIACVSRIKYLLHIPRSMDHTSEKRLCILYTCRHAPHC